MKICFIGHFTAGGTESATFLVANGLQKYHEVCVINSSNKLPSFYLDKEIKIDYLPSGNIIKRILFLARYIKKKKIDILISIEALTGIYTIPAVILGRCKHIVWDHANYYQNQGSKYMQIIRKIELTIADGYIVLTKRDLNNLKTHFKYKTLLTNIYNIAPSQEDVKYDLNSKTIISAGHIRKIKGFSIIPELGRIIFERYPDWTWKIYGEAVGEEYEKIVGMINEYGLSDNIIFCGRSKEMNSEYQKAAFYVMTSIQEGLPMVLLEAKSNKLPLISFDIETGPDEIIRNGVNGFLIQPYDNEMMVNKICILIENSNLRNIFSYNSKLDLDKFSSKKILKQWIELLDSVKKK